MFSITLDSAGKKYGREWIYRRLTHEFASGSKTVILGRNGSGKSTLLQMVAGYITPNEGKVNYSINGATLDNDEIFKHISLASPYLQLTEDFTGLEIATHLSKFKKFRDGLSPAGVLEQCYLQAASTKLVKQYSSGMKQRLKLGLAMYSDTLLLLLDEPASNLDAQAVDWYKKTMADVSKNRTVIVCSNTIEAEFAFCEQRLCVEDFK
jgi:ABC-type multidrug transport system ATPase subunit